MSAVSVSVFPLPTLACTNVNLLCTDSVPSAMLHLWDAGVEEVARMWPVLEIVRKLEFIETEGRCLPGLLGLTYCEAHMPLLSWFSLQTWEAVSEAT